MSPEELCAPMYVRVKADFFAMRTSLKNTGALLLCFAMVQAELYGMQGTASPSQTTTSPSFAPDTMVLRKGTQLCMVIDETVSTKTAKVGDQVKFRAYNDVSIEGLTVIPKDTEVGATITKVQKPNNFARNGRLSFAFDPVKLLNGQAVSLKAHKDKQPSDWSDPEIQFWLVVLAPIAVPMLAHTKGDEGVQNPTSCRHAEIAYDVSLEKSAIARLQNSGSVDAESNWKTRVRSLMPSTIHGLNAPAKGSALDSETETEIMELDTLTGRERVLKRCKGCSSPILCESCWKNQSSAMRILYLANDGIHILYANDDDWSIKTNSSLLARGKFSKLLTISRPFSAPQFTLEIAVLQSSSGTCRVLRLDVLHGSTLDSVDCKEIIGDPIMLGKALVRPEQVLEGRYVGDIPSQSAPGPDLVTGSLADDSRGVPPVAVPIPRSSEAYSRFDPIWWTDHRIIYVRRKL